MAEENVNFKIHVVGVSGKSSEQKPVTASLDATLQDVLDSLLGEKVIPAAPRGQEWKFKVGTTYIELDRTLREVGIKDGDNLKLILEQEWGTAIGIKVQKPVVFVSARKGILVQARQRSRQKAIEVDASNYDPRLIRIREVEEHVLRERGFGPADRSLTTWLGTYKGYPAQIFFPDNYPAQPLRWYWEKIPSRFKNVIDNQLCIEALLSKDKWAPDITIETVFEALDSHPYFNGR